MDKKEVGRKKVKKRINMLTFAPIKKPTKLGFTSIKDKKGFTFEEEEETLQFSQFPSALTDLSWEGWVSRGGKMTPALEALKKVGSAPPLEYEELTPLESLRARGEKISEAPKPPGWVAAEEWLKEKLEPFVEAITGLTARERAIPEYRKEVRLPFAKELALVRPAAEPGLLTMPVNLVFRLLEITPKVTFQTVQNYREIAELGKADPLTLPFDARRLGFDSPEIESTGKRLVDTFNRIQEVNPPESEADLWKNAAYASFSVAIPDTLDAFIAANIAGLTAKVILKATKYDPILERALSEMGLPINKPISPKEFLNRFSESLKAAGPAEKMRVWQDGAYIFNQMETSGIPVLNKFWRGIQNTVRDLIVPLQQRGIGYQVSPIAGRVGLPGYAKGVPIGLTIQKRVGQEIVNKAIASKSIQAFTKSLTAIEIAKIEVAKLTVAGVFKEATRAIKPEVKAEIEVKDIIFKEKKIKPEILVAEEVKKYESVEEYIKAKGLDPNSIDIKDSKNFIVINSAGKEAILTEIPLSEFEKPKFETVAEYEPGKKITDPIEVSIIDDKYKITDGANRFTQAVANGDKTIPVVLEKVIKQQDDFEAYLETEFGKLTPEQEKTLYEEGVSGDIEDIRKEAEGQLFKDIRELGGIKAYKGKFLAEELKPIPLILKNEAGITLDEMADSLKKRGYDFDSDSDLLKAILDIKKEPIKTVKGSSSIIAKKLKAIGKISPEKATKISKRLVNKLYRIKYPRVPAEQKAVRRAIELGKVSPEFENKTITEMRRIKGFTDPKSVPTERLSIFDNFINLNKIKRENVPHKQMGIAEIVRDGKTFPAIRQRSGFYATEEIQTAPIRDVYDQLLSPYHMALKQDLYKLGGDFGIMFKKVWKPTEKAIRGQKEFTNLYFKTIKDIGKRYKIVTSKKNLEHLSDVIERKVKATPKEEVFIRDIRNVLDDLRNQANDIRLKMRRSKIGYITDYIPHLQKTSLWNELLSNVATISDNLDFIIPNQIKNPFAYRRLLEEMPKAERNLYVLLDRYIRAISKDIYITPAIENIKVYNSVLKNRGLLNASRYWDEYIRVGLIGKQHRLDTALSVGLKARKGLQKWNSMVNLAFLTGKLAWNVATQPLSYIMNTPMEAGIINSIKAIYKSFGKGLRQYVKENSNVLAIKSGDVRAVAVGEGRNIQNRIYQTKVSKWNDFISMLGSVEERELTLTSYVAGLERAKNLGYKGQDALDFADLTAARTQSMYNKENRALILDSDIARTLFPFQSFSVEMFNHIKEIITKGGAESLKARQRLGKLFRLLVGIYLANLYAKTLTGRKKTTIGTFFPFIGNYVDMLIAQMVGDSYFGNRSPITVVQIGQDIIKGSKDFIKHGNINKLRKVGLNFGLSLGGIGGGGQINNIIDGIMADINEEVKNVEGDTMFEVNDALSKVIAPFFGVWATLEGRDYFEPSEEKKEWKLKKPPTERKKWKLKPSKEETRKKWEL